MRLGPKIITFSSLLLAALLAWLSAVVAADVIESRSGKAVRTALIEGGHPWAQIHSDGLQIHLEGTAPTEAARFNAITVAGRVVDSSRVVDATSVTPAQPLSAPDYSIEILRNDDGISLIGLVPNTLDRPALTTRIEGLAKGATVTDLLETANYPVPDGWDAAMAYGMKALAELPRSKVSIGAGTVGITAISTSAAEKRQLDADLKRKTPDNLVVTLDISAPRPVITPFTLRFLIDDKAGARFDACSADTERARNRIERAALAAGAVGPIDCTLGLGVPTPEWADAATQGIEALAELGGGALTIADADMSLVSLPEVEQARFDRVVGELESNLPEVFSLHSVRPEPVKLDTEDEETGPPRFYAIQSPGGQVQLRGRVTNELVRETVVSFAKARFGSEVVHTATLIDAELPASWPVRVLAGLSALSELEYGALVVQPDFLDLRGSTGNPDAQAEIARLLSEKLGEGQNFDLNIRYDVTLDPIVALPTAEECVGLIEGILAENKITFEPGSPTIEGPGIQVVDAIAGVLRDCRDVPMELEIGGHTDSQGRESMNLDLSQARANAVLEALMARRVLTSRITAKGYGESTPIASNDTEEGREANRRIEFRLVLPEEEAAPESADEAAAGADTGEPAATAPADGENAPSEAASDDSTTEDATNADSDASAETTEDQTGDAAVAPDDAAGEESADPEPASESNSEAAEEASESTDETPEGNAETDQ